MMIEGPDLPCRVNSMHVNAVVHYNTYHERYDYVLGTVAKNNRDLSVQLDFCFFEVWICHPDPEFFFYADV